MAEITYLDFDLLIKGSAAGKRARASNSLDGRATSDSTPLSQNWRLANEQ